MKLSGKDVALLCALMTAATCTLFSAYFYLTGGSFVDSVNKVGEAYKVWALFAFGSMFLTGLLADLGAFAPFSRRSSLVVAGIIPTLTYIAYWLVQNA